MERLRSSRIHSSPPNHRCSSTVAQTDPNIDEPDSDEPNIDDSVVDDSPNVPTAPGMRWYVVHTLSGHENKVRNYLLNSSDALDLGGQIGRVVVPTEEVVEMRDGRRVSSVRKFLPSYVLVEMQMTGESRHTVANVPGVTGFVGGSKADATPQPLSSGEVERILGQVERRSSAPEGDMPFRPGDMIKVIDGPFSDFSGTVEAVDPDKSKITVMVSIFGRPTPVELDVLQIELAPAKEG